MSAATWPQPGDVVRVDSGNGWCLWVGRVEEPTAGGTWNVRCLASGISPMGVGEVVDVRQAQLMPATAYTVGALAYIDCFVGMIPCKVLEVRATPGGMRLKVKVTADRPAYKRGEVVEHQREHDIVPRRSVTRRNTVRNDYVWLPPEVLT